MQQAKGKYQPIENYGIIGNLQTVALVSLKGSIDFMSFPAFDSPTIFASMLDADKGGCFTIDPQIGAYKSKQLYMPGTAILITRFFSKTGIAEITDFMPISGVTGPATCSIVRTIKAIRGNINFRLNCGPRFNYAKGTHTCEQATNGLIFRADDDEESKLRLIADFDLEINGNDGCAEFTVNESETANVVLALYQDGQPDPVADLPYYLTSAYDETSKFWHNWIRKSTYKGRWSELVFRSAITLKLLTSSQYGSVIAAPTFGLPELIGGNRNWDYRYTWIRDAAFSMYAFLRLGFYDEATHFLNWIHEVGKKGDLQLIYRYDGGTSLEEKELDYLDGYQSTKPVRIGNGAVSQLQIDIYGELIDTIYIYNKSYKPVTYEFWTMIEKFVDTVVKNWQLPDHGIWEIRSEKREFLHTRLMCWVAVDRAIKIAEQRTFPYPEAEWKKVRSDIYNDIYHNFWNDELKAWVQYKGAKVVDASALLMPLVHYISPVEPRWLSTMNVIDEKLRLDVLIYRYQNAVENIDGLDGEEGTFNMCSFWFIETLAKSGQVGRAVENFEKMLGYANHLGLFSEELGKEGEMLGNFPQAFTHLALISAALELNKQLERRE